MNRARAVLTALVLISALGLVGCSDDDPEPRTAPPSAEPTRSPSTTAAAEVLGPAATVRAWVSARNSALQDGDLTAVRGLTHSGCSSCEGILEPIAQVYRDGGQFDTEGWSIAGLNLKSRSTSKATVSTGLVFAGGRTVPERGAKPVSYGEERHIVIFRLRHDEGRWLVQFVGFLS